MSTTYDEVRTTHQGSQMQLLPSTIQPVVPPDTPTDMHLGYRTVHADLRSRNGFRWPTPGNWAEAAGPIISGNHACPLADGDGICIARTMSGATSGGIRSSTFLLVAYRATDVLGGDVAKVRVRRALVLDIFTWSALIGPRANLADANLAGAYLAGANLARANLARANLARADLARANLARANLAGANLAGAYLAGAYLADANLAGADLARARGSRLTVLPAGWRVDDVGLIVRDRSVR